MYKVNLNEKLRNGWVELKCISASDKTCISYQNGGAS